MPWLVETPMPVKFDERCAVCNAEDAVTTATMEHQNVVGFVGVAWVLNDLQIRVPCGERCDRRLRLLRRLFWALFLLPWILLTAISFIGSDWISNHVSGVLVGAGVFNALGYFSFAWRWWLMRSVRLVRVDRTRATLAVRSRGYAQRLGDANGAVPQKVLWTG